MIDQSGAPQVLVTHPTRQHSHQLALALEGTGLLAGYWSGLPTRPPWTRWVIYDAVPLPAGKVKHFYISPVVRTLANRMLSRPEAVAWFHRGDAWFDRWCARRLTKVNANAVVSYENAALKTFERAKALGWITILDAASFHHMWQDRFYQYEESDTVHASITRHKDQEIALADHILTVSEFARQSYVDAGVPPERVTAVPVGCDISRFEYAPRNPLPEQVFTFIFCGRAGERKGADVLLQASGRLHREGISHRVQFVGDVDPSLGWEHYPWVERKGRVSQQELARFFSTADCFVLPSRHDSFGMVVVEAMATGLPAIVSDHVGAREAITEDETGWVVPAEDVEALASRMRWCVEHRKMLANMGQRAATAAQRYSWEAYHERVVAVIKDLLRGTYSVPASTDA